MPQGSQSSSPWAGARAALTLGTGGADLALLLCFLLLCYPIESSVLISQYWGC